MSGASQLFWCRKCGVPLLQKRCENCGQEGHKICSDLKPMFDQECEFIERQIGRKLPGKSWRDGLWMRHKTIWFNGKRLMRLSADGKPRITREYKEYHNERKSQHLQYRITPEMLWMANRSTLDLLENEAIYFIREVTGAHPERKPVVSFSGGKDSAVVSYLVRKALGTEDILHIFGDTTIEYPDTYKYNRDFFKENAMTPFKVARNEHKFLKMCSLLDPPTRVNPWCCSVFKSGPIASIMNVLNDKHGVISFEGIRRKESIRRRDRKRTHLSKKIVHQLSAYPLVDWREIDVWLYILTKGLRVNLAYHKGFSRVGCMYCPNNTPYNEYLLRVNYPRKIERWLVFLATYAKKIGKSDPQEYVSSGAWKMRAGKANGKSSIYLQKTPCLKNTDAMHYILHKPISPDFIERFKPFGRLLRFSGNNEDGFVIRDRASDEPLFMIKSVRDINILKEESRIDKDIKLGEEFLCVDLLTSNNKYHLFRDIERQLKKFQACVLCGACAGICPTQAISVNSSFTINATKCNGCRRCISTKFLSYSCVALNSTRQGKDFGYVNRI